MTMRHSPLALGLVAGVLPAHAQLLSHKDLSLAIGTKTTQTALDMCTAPSYGGYGVSVVVVDRAGDTIVALRSGTAGPHTMENARRKAYTARTFGVSTSEYAKRYADNNPVVHQQVTLPNIIAIPGGLSGTLGKDEPCVQAGIDKVVAELK